MTHASSSILANPDAQKVISEISRVCERENAPSPWRHGHNQLITTVLTRLEYMVHYVLNLVLKHLVTTTPWAQTTGCFCSKGGLYEMIITMFENVLGHFTIALWAQTVDHYCANRKRLQGFS